MVVQNLDSDTVTIKLTQQDIRSIGAAMAGGVISTHPDDVTWAERFYEILIRMNLWEEGE